MKKTLVLVVDRDDDFGVKGRVNTPVIGKEECIEAANALGIADPEDSDTNALYAAISMCMDLQEDGFDAEVSLICGDEKVGHRSDLALVAQLEEVLDIVRPESVILVGDGAEDEYIYPIISSRAHVDSVRKVYIKQAPGIEGAFYIFTRILADPAKRKRFVAPVGMVLMLLSLFNILPNTLLFLNDYDMAFMASMAGSLSIFFIGLALVLYGYNVGDHVQEFSRRLRANMIHMTTKFIFGCIGVFIFLFCTMITYYDVGNTYYPNMLSMIIYIISALIWPAILACSFYIAGVIIYDYQISKAFRVNLLLVCLNLVALGMVGLGILDILQVSVSNYLFVQNGVFEIVAGVVLSIMANVLKSRISKDQVRADAV